MSISIKNLYQDMRDVGKTIKSTKKYFVWEFVLNGKYHKVEMFHSKVSGKKKLCVDAQSVSEDKSYKNDFTYSFKIDKNYFNCIQLSGDKYELRIDNRSFDILMQEERTGRLKADSFEVEKKKERGSSSHYSPPKVQAKANYRGSTQFAGVGSSNPRNAGGDDFFNDNDFEFDNMNNNNFNNRHKTINTFSRGGKATASSAGNVGGSINSFANFNEFNNKFSNEASVSRKESTNVNGVVGRNNNNQVSTSTNNANLLVDVNEIFSEKKNTGSHPPKDSKDLLNQINFEASEGNSHKNSHNSHNNGYSDNMDVYKHNQNVLSNLNIDGGSEAEYGNLHNNYNQMGMSSDVNSGMNNNAMNNFQNFQNNYHDGSSTQFNEPIGMNNNHSNFDNNGNNNAGNFFNQGNNSFAGGHSQNFDNGSNNDCLLNSNNNINGVINNNMNLNMNISNVSNNVGNNIDNNSHSVNTSIHSDNTNELKKKILTSGLVNLDNIFEDKKKSNTTQNSNSNMTYNFAFSSGGVPLNYMNNESGLKANMGSGTNYGNQGYSYPTTSSVNYSQMGYGMDINSGMNANSGMNMNNGMNMGMYGNNYGYNPNAYNMNNPNMQMNNQQQTNQRKATNTPFDF